MLRFLVILLLSIRCHKVLSIVVAKGGLNVNNSKLPCRFDTCGSSMAISSHTLWQVTAEKV